MKKQANLIQLAATLADNDFTGSSQRILTMAYRRLVVWRALKSAENTGYPLLHQDDLGPRHDTPFFILGSGASVEDLGAEHFRSIGQGFSVGVNAWPLHDFVSNAYALESCRNHERSVAISRALQRKEIVKSRPLVLLEVNSARTSRHSNIEIPNALLERTRLYAKTTAITEQRRTVEKELRRFLFKHKRGALPFWLSFGQNASIERLATLAIVHGFKDIVFVGVDLNNTSYFWEQNPNYLRRRGVQAFGSGQHGAIHKTADPLHNPVPTTDVLKILAELAGGMYGAKLWTCSPHSALAKFLDLYSWPFCDL